MKLKYYLRGMGIGIILTAIVMGFALGGRKATISDAEVIERAKALGMVDAGGVLSQTVDTPEADEGNQSINAVEEISNDSSASSSTLDKEGKEISEEDDQTVALASQPVSEVAKEEKKGEDKKSEDTKSSKDDNKQASSSSTENSITQKEEVKKAEESKKEEAKASNNKQETQVADSKNTDSSANQSTTSNESVLGSTTSVTKTVTIPGGIGSEQVAAILQREGVVDSAYSFNQYLCDKKMDRRIRSGVKTIPAGSTYEDIARIICKE